MARAKSLSGAKSADSGAVFPSPGHDHDRCSTDAMAVAEAVCAERGQRLTAIRRKVLAVLLGSHKPLGAYEIIEQLAPKGPGEAGPRPAPITAYRALEFLRENGLVHRIESRNAFIACVHNHIDGEFVVFLICENCGAVGEASSAEVAATLTTAARSAGFTPKSPVLEITGVCVHCRAK
jgi:Fur family zinc uptake transcriptional regulator